MAAMEKDTRISKFINSLLKTRKLNIRWNPTQIIFGRGSNNIQMIFWRFGRLL